MSEQYNTRKPLRVLVVEDSENDAILLLRELKRGGYDPISKRVDTPQQMQQALTEADHQDEPFELVISDYYMPRFQAPQALQLLREMGYQTPFIVVSGKVGEDLAVEIMRSGAHDYITKENMARLSPAIERELREAQVREERKKVQQELRRSQDRFRQLMEHAADAMFVHDLEGRVVDVNRRACESLGYSREELLGMGVEEIEAGYGRDDSGQMWEEVSGGLARTIEGEHRRKDGTSFPVEVRLGVFESDERPLILALARDITERKEADRQLREAETRYRTLVEQIPAMTYIEAAGRKEGGTDFLYVSPQVEKMFGYPPGEWLANPGLFAKLIHPEDRGRVLGEDDRTDETGEPFKIEYRHLTRDGRVLWVRDEAVLVRDEDGRPMFWQGITFDVTDQKRAEEEIRRAKNALGRCSSRPPSAWPRSAWTVAGSGSTTNCVTLPATAARS